jgi:hypothetical protein
MTERLTWRREGPRRFLADLPGGGVAEIAFKPGYSPGTSYWTWRIEIDGIIDTQVSAGGQQSAADTVNEVWPRVAARAAEGVAAEEDKQDVEAMVRAALQFDTELDIGAFAIEQSPRERLLHINWMLQHRFGSGTSVALPSLAAVVSAELHARRIGARPEPCAH